MPPPGPLPLVALLISIVGVALAAFAVYLHGEISSSHGEFSSFCDVSAEVSCDAVLGSTYATFLGTPVATWGLVGWLAALGIAIWTFLGREFEVLRRATWLLAIAGTILAVSLYFLLVSIVNIGVFCPICLSLDAAALGLFGVAFALVRLLAPGAPRSWQPRPVFLAAAAATAVFLFVIYQAQSSAEPQLRGPVTVEMVREEAPRFYAEYLALPIVPMPLPAGAQDSNAEIRVVEFSDFECPHCRRAFFDLDAALKQERRNGGESEIQVWHRNFPLDGDCNPQVQSTARRYSCDAARGSVCAHRAGKGHAFDAEVFGSQGSLTSDSFGEFAEELGLDPKKFADCMSSPATAAAIRTDLSAARAVNVRSTPTIFINGREVRGAFSPTQFRYAFAIERAELAKRKSVTQP